MFTEEEQLLLDFISENSLLVSLKFYKLETVSWDFLGLQSVIAWKFHRNYKVISTIVMLRFIFRQSDTFIELLMTLTLCPIE